MVFHFSQIKPILNHERTYIVAELSNRKVRGALGNPSRPIPPTVVTLHAHAVMVKKKSREVA